ncbi:MAG: indole-3-glycerol-phosphate synthase, partial [Alphaproteobacteria bacterium]|nr:indole-3-glycerol-phosphate synthase [Alphaproteobacteria bacterium]
AAVKLPVLRKDFMLDPYQVTETRAWGADCILIIMALTDDAQSRELFAIARNYHGMDVLVEVHNEGELDRALALGADIIGINNRDLKTFSIDLGVTLRLAPRIPADKLVVAESGLARREDLALLAKAGVTTFLIGEGLMRHKDVAAATSALIGAKLNP